MEKTPRRELDLTRERRLDLGGPSGFIKRLRQGKVIKRGGGMSPDGLLVETAEPLTLDSALSDLVALARQEGAIPWESTRADAMLVVKVAPVKARTVTAEGSGISREENAMAKGSILRRCQECGTSTGVPCKHSGGGYTIKYTVQI